MAEEPKPATGDPVEPPTVATPPSEQELEDIGDFITRHVLEKDSVFFEG
jgi:hypothetical protein